MYSVEHRNCTQVGSSSWWVPRVHSVLHSVHFLRSALLKFGRWPPRVHTGGGSVLRVHSARHSVHSRRSAPAVHTILWQWCTQVVGGRRQSCFRCPLTALCCFLLLSSTEAVRKHCCVLHFAAIRLLLETNVWSA